MGLALDASLRRVIRCSCLMIRAVFSSFCPLVSDLDTSFALHCYLSLSLSHTRIVLQQALWFTLIVPSFTLILVLVNFHSLYLP